MKEVENYKKSNPNLTEPRAIIGNIPLISITAVFTFLSKFQEKHLQQILVKTLDSQE